MEDNLEIHLEEVHPKEIRRESHLSIHLLDLMDCQRMFIPPWNQPPIVQPVSKPSTKLPNRKLQYPTYVKDINLDAHIRVFKKAIKPNGEIVEVDIINMFGFTFRDSISNQGENYVQDHPNYIFEELEQAFCK
jgi:hypothetical protein